MPYEELPPNMNVEDELQKQEYRWCCLWRESFSQIYCFKEMYKDMKNACVCHDCHISHEIDDFQILCHYQIETFEYQDEIDF